MIILYHAEIASLAFDAPTTKKAITIGYLTTVDRVRFSNTAIQPAIGIEPPIIVDLLQAWTYLTKKSIIVRDYKKDKAKKDTRAASKASGNTHSLWTHFGAISIGTTARAAIAAPRSVKITPAIMMAIIL